MQNLMKMTMITLVLLVSAGTALASGDFPLREKYPQVKPISLEQLNQSYDDTIIIDVRSKDEFDVIHINKALNLPVTKGNFLSDLENTRAKGGTTDIAFYCNGHTCAKSYKASQKALDAGFENVYCFDAGIFEWASAYPDKAMLVGQTPVRPEKLISKADLNSHKIEFADFKDKTSAKNAMVIDLRDPFQRAKDATLPQNKNVDLQGIRNIPMDRLVKLIKKGELKDKQLLIFDAVGKQVRWLQYHLEDAGYRDYYFLAKGVLSAADAGAIK